MRIRCSACSALLNVADQVAGKRIRCPRCKAATVAEPAAAEEQQSKRAIRAASSAAKPPRSASKTSGPRQAVDDEDDATPRRRKKTTQPKNFNGPLIAGIAVAGGAMLCIAITTAVLVFANATAPQPEGALAPVGEPARNADANPIAGAVPMAANGKPLIVIAVVPSQFKLPDASEGDYLKKKALYRKGMARTLRQAYDRIGKRDPKWDGEARQALDLAALMYADFSNTTIGSRDIYPHVVKAIEAGCDDPMILYLYARTFTTLLTPEEGVSRRVRAADALRDSKYSPYRRSVALQLASEVISDRKGPGDRQTGEKYLTDALDAFVESINTESNDPVVRSRFVPHVFELQRAAHRIFGDSVAAFKHVEDAIGRAPAGESLRLRTRGEFMIHHAWEARGSGFASTVAPEQFRLFAERLREALDCLEKAWDLDPTDGSTAAFAITALKGLNAEPAQVKIWFDRAMSADPCNRQACEHLMDYLDPKWHGSMEEVVAFGRECRIHKVIQSGIPLLAAEAHFRAVGARPADEMVAYIRSPAVWTEIADVHQNHFRKNHDPTAHGSFAVYCAAVGDFRTASREFQLAGSQLPRSMLWTQKTLEGFRDTSLRLFPPPKGPVKTPQN